MKNPMLIAALAVTTTLLYSPVLMAVSHILVQNDSTSSYWIQDKEITNDNYNAPIKLGAGDTFHIKACILNTSKTPQQGAFYKPMELQCELQELAEGGTHNLGSGTYYTRENGRNVPNTFYLVDYNHGYAIGTNHCGVTINPMDFPAWMRLEDCMQKLGVS